MLAARCVAVAILLVSAVACSSGGGGDENGDADQGGPTTTASCLGHSSDVRRHTPAGSEDVFLVEARVSKIDDCVDQVTFEFRSDGRQLPPGYAAEYAKAPFVDFTSGDEFEPAGDAYLVIRFAKTAVFGPTMPGAAPEPTYTGRESIDPSGMNHLQEARIVQGPEGVIQWVIGLDSKRPFNVDASSLAILPVPSSTTTTSTTPPSGSTSSSTTTSTSTNTPSTSTTTPTAATSRIVVRIG